PEPASRWPLSGRSTSWTAWSAEAAWGSAANAIPLESTEVARTPAPASRTNARRDKGRLNITRLSSDGETQECWATLQRTTGPLIERKTTVKSRPSRGVLGSGAGAPLPLGDRRPGVERALGPPLELATAGDRERVVELHLALPRRHGDVVEGEAAFAQPEERDVGRAADPQRAELGTVHRPRGARGGALHDVVEAHPERQELGHRGGQVEHRPLDAHLVDVARDHVGRHPVGEHRLGGVERERACAVADVHHQAALPQLLDVGQE